MARSKKLVSKNKSRENARKQKLCKKQVKTDREKVRQIRDLVKNLEDTDILNSCLDHFFVIRFKKKECK